MSCLTSKLNIFFVDFFLQPKNSKSVQQDQKQSISIVVIVVVLFIVIVHNCNKHHKRSHLLERQLHVNERRMSPRQWHQGPTNATALVRHHTESLLLPIAESVCVRLIQSEHAHRTNRHKQVIEQKTNDGHTIKCPHLAQ
jgi:hypothetical protein